MAPTARKPAFSLPTECRLLPAGTPPTCLASAEPRDRPVSEETHLSEARPAVGAATKSRIDTSAYNRSGRFGILCYGRNARSTPPTPQRDTTHHSSLRSNAIPVFFSISTSLVRRPRSRPASSSLIRSTSESSGSSCSIAKQERHRPTAWPARRGARRRRARSRSVASKTVPIAPSRGRPTSSAILDLQCPTDVR